MTAMRYQAKANFTILLTACFMSFFATFSNAYGQEYRLQPGDTLQADIVRVQGASWASLIDTDGYVRFPYIGKHLAAGKTLDDLADDVSLAVVGQEVNLFDGTRETGIILDENSVFLTVAQYRPVTVLGAVTAPGRVEYAPGLTVRALLGAVGGIAYLTASNTNDAERILSLNARLSELRKTEAWLLLDLWGARGQLEEAYQQDPPEDFAEVLQQRLDAQVIQDMQTRITEALRDKERRIAGITDRITLTQERISYLTRALEQYEVVSDGEEERLASLLQLRERGLTVATNVNNARSGALAASSRLLATEADLSEAKREVRNLTEQSEAVATDLRQDLLREQARFQRSLDEVSAQIAGVTNELRLRKSVPLDDGSQTAPEPSMILYRLIGLETVPRSVAMEDKIMPGDVLEVSVPSVLSAP